MNATNEAKKPSNVTEEPEDEDIDVMSKMIPKEAKTCGVLSILNERQSSLGGLPLSPLNLLGGPMINQKWTKRWFVIEEGFLTYYKKKQDTEFAGMPIDLLFCSVKELEVPGQKYCFQLVGKDEVSILLHAESEGEMLEWVGSLRDAITSVRANVITDSSPSPMLGARSGLAGRAKEDHRENKKGVSVATASTEDSEQETTATHSCDKAYIDVDDNKEDIILQGFLKKQTHSRFNKYKKRWCVLTADSLTYYPDKPAAEEKKLPPSGSMQILFAMAHALPKGAKEAAYPFELLTANRNFVFLADSEETRNEWVSAIRDLNAKLMRTQLQHTLHGRERSIASMLAKSGSKLNIRELNIPEDDDSPEGRECRKQLLLSIAKKVGNNVCADCGQENPDWASINLGVTLCIECAGVHRSLGAHITKVRSLNLDDWDISDIRFLERTGNVIANRRWLQFLPANESITPTTDVKTREEYIRKKYTSISPPNVSPTW